MSLRPDTQVINDPKEKKAVEKLKETIYQVLTAKGKTELSNNKEEIEEQCNNFFRVYTDAKTPEDKEQMIATEKKNYNWE